MKLIETKKGLVIQTKYGDITIHINHTHDTLEDFQDDIRQHHWWSPYMVAEECTNHARVHLVYASSKIHALEQVDEYLREKEGIAKGIKFIFVNNIKIVEETHLITAEELDFDLKAKPRWMEDLRNMLAIMASGYRYNELTADGQEYVQSKANYLYNKFDGRISDVHHVITYAKFKGWL